MNYRLIATAAVLSAFLTAPAVAQQAAPQTQQQQPSVAKGSSVYGSDGASLGTVAEMQGEVVVIEVDGRAIPIPKAALAAGAKGLTVNITKTALVAQFDQQKAKYDAQLAAAITEGASVKTADGQLLGTIESRNEQGVVVNTDKGPATLPRQLLALNQDGTLIARATKAQIDQAMAGAAGGR